MKYDNYFEIENWWFGYKVSQFLNDKVILSLKPKNWIKKIQIVYNFLHFINLKNLSVLWYLKSLTKALEIV